MIKIIQVITDTNLGGAGVWLLNYLSSFNREKYDVSVALPEGAALLGEIKKQGVKTFEIPYIADMSYSKEGTKEFFELFKRERPDIVHAHASLSARIAAKKLGIKTVNTRHCLEDKKPFYKRAVYGAINNRLSDIVIGVSKAAADNLIADGTKKSKLRIIYNGAVPPEKQSAEHIEKIKTKFLNIKKNNTVIGMIARIEPVKDHEFFVDAAAEVLKKRKDITFLIVGGGSLEGHIREKAKKMGIADSFIFCGKQAHIDDFLNACDILALTSKKEALSLSLIEGMFLGKPSVSTASGGPEEVIENGKTGIIVYKKDPAEFAKALLSLAEDREKREEFSKNAVIRAQALFSVGKMADELDKIYNELTEGERK